MDHLAHLEAADIARLELEEGEPRPELEAGRRGATCSMTFRAVSRSAGGGPNADAHAGSASPAGSSPSARSGTHIVIRPGEAPARTSMLTTRTLSSRLATCSTSGDDSNPTYSGWKVEVFGPGLLGHAPDPVRHAADHAPFERGQGPLQVLRIARAAKQPVDQVVGEVDAKIEDALPAELARPGVQVGRARRAEREDEFGEGRLLHAAQGHVHRGPQPGRSTACSDAVTR